MSLNFGSNTRTKKTAQKDQLIYSNEYPNCILFASMHRFTEAHKDALINIGKGSVGHGLSAAHCERISTKGICQIASRHRCK